MRLADLIRGLSIELVSGPADTRICDITEDSRTVLPGSLFIARRGEKADGRSFIGAAVESGAAAVLTDDPGVTLPRVSHVHEPVVLLRTRDIQSASAQLAERFYGDPSSHLTMIGVTGTKGKTTTTYLIHQILNQLGIRCGMIGTVSIDDGVETAPAVLTTPPALEVSRTLGRMVEAGCTACVMEVSSHALHQRRVAAPGGVGFRAAVFTNLSGDHLDYHKTMEAYADAKAMLFESLPSDADGGVAVVNISDPAHSRMVAGTPARILRCALDQPLAVRTGGTASDTLCIARLIAAGAGYSEVEFRGPWGRSESSPAAAGGTMEAAETGGHCVRIPLVGAFNVMNALQAVTTVHALFGGTGEDDLSFDIIAQALARCTAPPGRMQPVTAPEAPVTVLVDYAHTDDALRNVLATTRQSLDAAARSGGPRGRLLCVFGCGGDRDRTKRPRMGQVAADLADLVYITSDNPRTEDPAAIISEILAGVPAGAQPRCTIEADRETAIHAAIHAARPGDTVVIAGKGHETYQILPDPARRGATITREFDDRAVARAALGAVGIAAVKLDPDSRATDADEDDDEGSVSLAPRTDRVQRGPSLSRPR